jgi:protein-disulfide isomerase
MNTVSYILKITLAATTLCILACSHEYENSPSLFSTQKKLLELERQVSFLNKRVKDLEKSNSRPQKSDEKIIKRNITFELDDGFFDDPFFGSQDPETIIVIYTDLQCTLCRDFLANTLVELKNKFRDSSQVQVRLRDFPLQKSSLSIPLAMAAHCAGEKGKYWEFISGIKIQKLNSQSQILDIAKGIPDLPYDSFISCLESGKYAREIELDKAHATSVGVKGTPSILLGKRIENRLYSGSLIRGNQPLGLILEELSFL